MPAKVFEVDAPFRIYRQVGSFPSNAHYGSAQIHRGKFEAVNARIGDEIHALPGGLFLSRPGGPTWSIRLSPPKEAFESDRSVYTKEEILSRHPRVSETSSPRTVCDWKGAGAIATKSLPPSEMVVEVEPSPEMEMFEETAWELLDAIRKLPFESGAKWSLMDHTVSPTIDLTLYLGPGMDFRLEWAFMPDLAFFQAGPREKNVRMSTEEGIRKALDRVNEITASLQGSLRL